MNIVSIRVEHMFYILVSIFGIMLFSQSYAADACTMEYAPVCGSVQVQCITAPCNPVKQTFSNSCMARSAHATDVKQGACDEKSPVTHIKKSPSQALQSGTWSIDTFNNKSIISSGTITFDKKTFSAKLCNMMNGQYGTISNVLIFRKVMSTRMYCDSDIMAVEDAMSFTRARFLVGENMLVITTRKGDTITWKKQ